MSVQATSKMSNSVAAQTSILRWWDAWEQVRTELPQSAQRKPKSKALLSFAQLWAWKQETIKAPGSVGERMDA